MGKFFVSTLCAIAFALAASMPAQAQELEERIELCTSCHGQEGIPIDAEIPILWGQEFYYLYVQLKDYKAGRRANEIMTDIAAELDKPTMEALAQYFADKTWPHIPHRGDDTLTNQAESGLSAGLCTQCHLGRYTGNSRIPRLAGQQPDYLKRTMLDFKEKLRLNSPAKGSLLGAYEDDVIAAMADYLAGL